MKKQIAIMIISLTAATILSHCSSKTITPLTDQKQNAKTKSHSGQLYGGSKEDRGNVCVDSDHGKNYFQKGEITVGGVVVRVDSCSDAVGPMGPGIIEWYCDPSDEYGLGFSFEEYQCPGKCRDGACVEE